MARPPRLVQGRDSRPRRGRVDREGRLWFGEYQGNAIGMFDPKTERMTEWKVPTPWSAPYDAVAGRNGEAWTGSMLTDRVARPRHQERPVHGIHHIDQTCLTSRQM